VRISLHYVPLNPLSSADANERCSSESCAI